VADYSEVTSRPERCAPPCAACVSRSGF
jgi:hypothetical protein